MRYVGTLARKQLGSLNLNTNTTLYNPELFDALERTRRGENVELFDQMLAGLDFVNAAGYNRVGTCTALAGAPGDGYCRQAPYGNAVLNTCGRGQEEEPQATWRMAISRPSLGL